MSLLRLDIDDRQVVMHTEGAVCASTQELVESESFARVVELYVDHLESHNPAALAELGLSGRAAVLDLIRLLANNPLERVARTWAGPGDLFAGRERLHEFVEGLYDFWRRWDRFLVVRADCRRAAGRQASAACLQPDGRDTGAAGPRPLSRRRRERHRRAAARLPSGRGRRRGGRLCRAAEVAGPGSLPRAAGRHPLRAQPAHVPAPAARPADQHAQRPVHGGRRQPARRSHAGARAVALLPGAGRPARRLRLLPSAVRRPGLEPCQSL